MSSQEKFSMRFFVFLSFLVLISSTGFTDLRSGDSHIYLVHGRVILLNETDMSYKILKLPHEVAALYTVAQSHVNHVQNNKEQIFYYGANPSKSTRCSDETSGFDLYKASLNGGQPELIFGSQAVLRAAWSDSGKFLLIWTKNMELYLLENGIGKPLLITDHGACPDISPDGTKIAYSRLPDDWIQGSIPGTYELHIFDMENFIDIPVVLDQDAAEPMWMRDGKKIIFISGGKSGIGSFWSVKPDGSDLVQLTNKGKAFVDETTIPLHRGRAWWSDHGNSLLWSRLGERGSEIWVMTLDSDGDKADCRFINYGIDPRWTIEKNGEQSIIYAQQPASDQNAMIAFVKTDLFNTSKPAKIQSSLVNGMIYGPEPALPVRPDRNQKTIKNQELDSVSKTSIELPDDNLDAADYFEEPGGNKDASSRYSWPLSYYPGYSCYYDNNSGSGLLDYKCGTYTYNGHKGTDLLASYGSVVYNGDYGSVYYRYDNCDDYGYLGNTCGGGFGNYLKFQNDSGWYSIYAHLKRGAVIGYGTYKCRKPVARTASSGNSSGPHLHFQVDHYGYPYDDPFAGPCSGDESFWVNQGSGNPSKGCQ